MEWQFVNKHNTWKVKSERSHHNPQHRMNLAIVELIAHRWSGSYAPQKSEPWLGMQTYAAA
jgi:hypothetical protein